MGMTHDTPQHREYHDTNAGALPRGVPVGNLFVKFRGNTRGQRIVDVSETETGARLMVTTHDPRIGRAVTREFYPEESVRWWYVEHRP